MDWGSIGSGIGGLLGPVGGLAGGALGGFFGKEKKETPMQENQREMVDQLLSSLKGQGPFSNLFNVDEASFQKSFVDPMKQKFETQIAPQIQQSYISSGQQRGTGMQGDLTRAGVDIDQLLNQYYAQMQEGAQNRQSNTMNSILGMGPGAPQTPTGGQAAMQGLSGYMTSDNFGQNLDDLLKSFTNKKGGETFGDTYTQQRKGFENEPQSYDYKSGRMG